MSPEALQDLLRGIGLQGVVRRGSSIMACCPSHKERRPSWGVSISSPHVHGCFACSEKGTLGYLLSTKFGWSKEKVENVLGKQEASVGTELSFRASRSGKTVYYAVDEQELWPFTLDIEARKYLASRGINFPTMKKTGCLYHRKDNRVLFPWYWDSKLYGMTGRACYETDDGDKIKAYCGLKKSNLLYVPSRSLIPDEDVVLVEGEIDSLKVFQAGIKNVAALGHGRLSHGAATLLKTLPVKKLILFLDNDRRGEELTEEIAKEMNGSCEVYRVNWNKSTCKDAGEMSRSEILRILRNPVKTTFWPRFK